MTSVLLFIKFDTHLPTYHPHDKPAFDAFVWFRQLVGNDSSKIVHPNENRARMSTKQCTTHKMYYSLVEKSYPKLCVMLWLRK